MIFLTRETPVVLPARLDADEEPYYEQRMRRSGADGGTAVVAFVAVGAVAVIGWVGWMVWTAALAQGAVWRWTLPW